MAKRLPFIILLWFGTDLYFYQAIYTLSTSATWLWLYWAVDLALMGFAIMMLFMKRGSKLHGVLVTWLMGLMLLIFIPRLFSLPVLLIEDITRLFSGFPPRSMWVSELTLALATILFCIILFGITRGKHFTACGGKPCCSPTCPKPSTVLPLHR